MFSYEINVCEPLSFIFFYRASGNRDRTHLEIGFQMHLWKDAKSQWSHKLKHETSRLLHQWRIWRLILCAPTLTFFSTLLSPVAKSSSTRLSPITLNSCTLFSVCFPVINITWKCFVRSISRRSLRAEFEVRIRCYGSVFLF